MTSPASSSTLRRAPWLWAAVAAAVVAAVVVVVLLSTGDDGEAAAPPPATPTTTSSAAEPGYDLSTPRAAAESFAQAAGTGSGDELLELTCAGHAACVTEHSAGMSGAQLTEVQNTIRDGVYELAQHLQDAEFAEPVDGETPGSKNVPYRTPAMTGDAYLTLTFVQSDGDWLYLQPSS